LHIEISREDLLLDTGGGLKKAGWFFAKTSEPFILHNVDVISTVDFSKMLAFHRANDALATLAVQKRESSRYLIFDEHSQLCGWRRVKEYKLDMVRSSENTQEVAFAGIHIISPRLIPMITESGTFSIIPVYLRLAGLGEKIVGFRADDSAWRDLGTPENVAEARREFEGT
jgi:NDP-sugar pyrophosphorylase family protein